ncbi:MAG: RnfABCDGE type electron transport complex subunit C [Bacilli bacterium]|jgi:electron transport complex protein RnfC|nr:RnfABCDGE type electron transport complex subunit C [Bacilli bacterium]
MLSGVKVISNKKMSISDNIIEYKDPEIVYIPLVNHSNFDCKCLVSVGDKVLKGSVIGKRNDNIELPIHASVSGEVIGIEEKLYLNGQYVKCVLIKNDFKEKQAEFNGVKESITSYSKEKFIDLLKDCAVTGMGGSDFPTYLKYKNKLNTIIINAVECEPYLTADFMIAKLKTEEILEAIDAIMEINKMDKGIIAIKEGNSELKERFELFLGTYPNISLVLVDNIYPMGWEKHLIKKILDVKYDKLPSEKEIVVNNISTIYAIYRALKKHTPISRRIVTITGEKLKKPQNVLIKIGTSINEVINEIGGYKKADQVRLIAGGPMMGTCLDTDELIVTKNLSGVLVLPAEVPDDDITCLRCGRCDAVCPADLSPALIREYKNDYNKLKHLHPERCIECGLCSYVCPSKIDVRGAVKEAKKEIRRH